jgi:hypothetical protein
LIEKSEKEDLDQITNELPNDNLQSDAIPRLLSMKSFSKLLNTIRGKRIRKYFGWSNCDKCPNIENNTQNLAASISSLEKQLGHIAYQKSTKIQESKEKLQLLLRNFH